MKHLDEFRDPARARKLLAALGEEVTRPWTVMEVCGGQTHALMRTGIPGLLPEQLELLHGPGCPVCVTPLEAIDRAHELARRGFTLASFGDMLRVPGSEGSLLDLKNGGADVRVVVSPLDALALAREDPSRQVVFFAVGFETTAPACAMALKLARDQGVENFSALVSHVLVPPAMAAILEAEGCRVQGFLGPGHVMTIEGLAGYRPLVERYRVPVVVTGFEPVDLLDGLLRLVRQLEAGEARVENAYARAAHEGGNPHARAVVAEVFEVCERKWRGVGTLPASGLRLRPEFAAHDAAARFDVGDLAPEEPAECRAGEVLQGLLKPSECPAFGGRCTPENPLGATMVSAEGACAAYHAYSSEAPGGS